MNDGLFNAFISKFSWSTEDFELGNVGHLVIELADRLFVKVL